jgi:hypothetical protein
MVQKPRGESGSGEWQPPGGAGRDRTAGGGKLKIEWQKGEWREATVGLRERNMARARCGVKGAVRVEGLMRAFGAVRGGGTRANWGGCEATAEVGTKRRQAARGENRTPMSQDRPLARDGRRDRLARSKFQARTHGHG